MIIKYSILPFAVFCLTYGAFWGLLKLSRSKEFIFKNYIAPSKKSTSGAILLGGAPLMLGLSTALFCTYGLSYELALWAIPASLLSFVGFLDDMFEVRARVKLFFQLFSTALFAALFTHHYQADISTFSLLMFFGLGVLNGANLLDGIDTYSIKYASSIFFATASVACWLGHFEVALASSLCAIPFGAFYFFNKSPSKIHLGEIGGGVIGLTFLFISSHLYISLTQATSLSTAELSIQLNIESFLFAFSFLHLPMCELGISLLRRVIKKKSPFCGDKLHLHSLLTDRESLNAHKASNKLVAFHVVGAILTIGACMGISPIAGFFGSGIYYVSYYLYLGAKYWFSQDESISIDSLFTSLKEQNLNAYDFSSLNDFSFEFDYIESSDESAANIKKAS